MQYTVGTRVFGDWTIVRAIGEGSFGTVYEIQKSDFGVTTRSALKVIRVPRSQADVKAVLSDGMDDQSVTTYFQGVVNEIVKEIAVMSALKSHPNIVSCEDHQVIAHEGEIGWDILIRMELLTSLQDYQMRHPMTEPVVRRLGLDLGSALAFCEKKGLIHRDIKPENIFVSETGLFKLGDFGVARTAEKTTGGLSKKGTESYMAPEVYLGRPYGATVDICSLGLVLYKFLNNNRLPFFPPYPQPISFADRENALGRRMRGEPLPAPANASPEMAAVILKACAYDPRQRYRSAEELLQALRGADAVQQTAPAQPAWDDDSEGTSGVWSKPVAKPAPQPAVPQAEEDDLDKTTGFFRTPPRPAPEPAAQPAEVQQPKREPSFRPAEASQPRSFRSGPAEAEARAESGHPVQAVPEPEAPLTREADAPEKAVVQEPVHRSALPGILQGLILLLMMTGRCWPIMAISSGVNSFHWLVVIRVCTYGSLVLLLALYIRDAVKRPAGAFPIRRSTVLFTILIGLTSGGNNPAYTVVTVAALLLLWVFQLTKWKKTRSAILESLSYTLFALAQFVFLRIIANVGGTATATATVYVVTTVNFLISAIIGIALGVGLHFLGRRISGLDRKMKLLDLPLTVLSVLPLWRTFAHGAFCTIWLLERIATALVLAWPAKSRAS